MIVDCHVHVFGNRQAYPLRRPGPAARVPVATAEDLKARCIGHGISGGIVVNPVEYGSDTRCLEAALQVLGPGFLGVVMADPDIDEAAVRSLKARGVIGFRMMCPARYGLAPANALFDETVRLAGANGWQLRLLVDPECIERIAARVMGVDDVAIVLEHMALFPPHLAHDGSAPYEALKALQRKPNVWTHLSANRRLAGDDMQEIVALAHRHLEACEGRCIWGSDWPHPAGSLADDAVAMDFADRVCGTPGDKWRLLAGEPAKLLALASRAASLSAN